MYTYVHVDKMCVCVCGCVCIVKVQVQCLAVHVSCVRNNEFTRVHNQLIMCIDAWWSVSRKCI